MVRTLLPVLAVICLVLAGCQSISGARDDEAPSKENGWRGTHNYSRGI